MGIDILLGVLARHTQVFHKMFLASPAPVVGPEMNVAIVYILVGTDTFIAGDIVLTSPTALASDTDEVVTVERTNEAACLCQPAKAGNASLLKARGSLPICHDMMAGSST